MTSPSWSGRRAAALRAELQKVIDRGEGVCVKCGRIVAPGHLWDVDHLTPRDVAPALTWQRDNLGVAHRYCNRSAGAVQGNRKRGHDPRPSTPPPKPSRDW